MISEKETLFLERCFADIGPTANIRNFIFLEGELIDKKEQVEEQLGDFNRNWKKFFSRDGEADNGEKEYTIDTDVILNEYVDSISHSWIKSTNLITNERWKKELLVETSTCGELKFRVFFDNQVSSYPTNLFKREFSIWFLEPRNIQNDETSFQWSALLKNGFWKNLKERLSNRLDPMSMSLYRKDSPAANDNADAINWAIRSRLDEVNLEVFEDQRADEAVNHSYFDNQVLFTAQKSSNSSIVVCECDVDPNHFHFHYTKEGDPVNVEQSEEADKVRKYIGNQIRDYNSLKQKKKDIPQFLRVFVLGYVAMVGAFSLTHLSLLLEFVGINPQSEILQQTQLILAIVLILIGLGFTILISIPWLYFNKFDWENKGVINRIRNRSI